MKTFKEILKEELDDYQPMDSEETTDDDEPENSELDDFRFREIESDEEDTSIYLIIKTSTRECFIYSPEKNLLTPTGTELFKDVFLVEEKMNLFKPVSENGLIQILIETQFLSKSQKKRILLNEPKKVKRSLYLDKILYEKLDKVSRKTGKMKSRMIQESLIDYLKKIS
ncbi:MAG: ribbon-helix-helix domain-containing protein [SAR324 cluster bacterium]|nr:ribbon-helix-helix domain-containing protein [SAR324 cluster bacterium]